MGDDREEIYERGEAVISIFKRGAEFTKAILEENEKLRRRLAQVESRQVEAAQDPDQWDKLRSELGEHISRLETEKRSILERLQAVEAENQDFAERYLEIEEENNNLANLYVASYQLHSTLDPNEVLKIIVEIVINLIGAEIFCVCIMDDKTMMLRPVAAEGEPVEAFPALSLGAGFVGQAMARGEVATQVPDPSSDEPMVCIPLCVSERPVGAIVLYRLLQQKEGFSALDHELFTLLAGHAATAIFSSRLFGQSERKLSTIQGFIELLSK